MLYCVSPLWGGDILLYFSPPTLTQLSFKASWRYYSQHEVGLLPTVEWIRAITGDAGPTFNRHWFCVGLHCQSRSPANTRRWTSVGFMLGDLVTIDHLCGSTSWHSEASGAVNLAGKDAVDIKKGFHHIKIHSLYLSTVQRSHLVTLITKAIDTTSNSYQPLWLRCWRGDISSSFLQKTRLFIISCKVVIRNRTLVSWFCALSRRSHTYIHTCPAH